MYTYIAQFRSIHERIYGGWGKPQSRHSELSQRQLIQSPRLRSDKRHAYITQTGMRDRYRELFVISWWSTPVKVVTKVIKLFIDYWKSNHSKIILHLLTILQMLNLFILELWKKLYLLKSLSWPYHGKCFTFFRQYNITYISKQLTAW